MPILSDKIAIRKILSTDRIWSLYALGDLAPGFFERSKWLRPADDPRALALLYRAFETPVLFTIGARDAIASLLPEIAAEPSLYLQVRTEVPSVLEARYRITGLKPMWRMALDTSGYRPHPQPDAARLGPADLVDVRDLFADGEETGEAPDFFTMDMLADGCFFGIRDGGRLAAVAGTHLVAPGEGVAAVGCVYTRRTHRGRGLAARNATAAVNELLRRRIPTIGLNVNQQNDAAIRIYERLGFVKYCDFREGVAVRDSGFAPA